MNNLRNKVQLIGHLGQTPEIISTENGNKVANFTMATNETFKNSKGEKQTETQWHNIFAWGKLADILENHIKKGDEIALEGKLVNSSYKTKDGTMRYVTKIQANQLLMLNKKQS
jgi:single-strand DNA-binding protein